MKQFLGALLFVGILVAAGIVVLKHVQLSSEDEVLFREDTPVGASQYFVRAMAKGDLSTMQEFADDAMREECPELLRKFSANVKGKVERFEVLPSPDSYPERVVMRVVNEGGVYHVTLLVRKVGERSLIRRCEMGG